MSVKRKDCEHFESKFTNKGINFKHVVAFIRKII